MDYVYPVGEETDWRGGFMGKERILEAEDMILAMADIVHENRALRKELTKYRMKSIMYDARLYGKNELAEKIDRQISENCSAELVKSCGWLSSDVFRTLEDMDLTPEEYQFVARR